MRDAPKDHPCGRCGATPAPYGCRLPSQPKRYIWACEAHRDVAETAAGIKPLHQPTQGTLI